MYKHLTIVCDVKEPQTSTTNECNISIAFLKKCGNAYKRGASWQEVLQMLTNKYPNANITQPALFNLPGRNNECIIYLMPYGMTVNFGWLKVYDSVSGLPFAYKKSAHDHLLIDAEQCAICAKHTREYSGTTWSNSRRYVRLSNGKLIYVCSECYTRLQEDTEFVRALDLCAANQSYRTILVEKSYTLSPIDMPDYQYCTIPALIKMNARKCKCGKITAHPLEVDGKFYCPECAEKMGFKKCPDCGKLFKPDPAATGIDAQYCQNCAMDRYEHFINDYHASKHKWDTVSSFRGVGFELELEGASNVLRSRAKIAKAFLPFAIQNRLAIERDGSLDYGAEIISAPNTIDDMHALICDITPTLNELRDVVDDNARTAGLHVHVSRTVCGNSDDAVAKLLYFTTKFSATLFDISRRAEVSDYALPMDDVIGIANDCPASARAEKCQRYAARQSGMSRYGMLNLANARTIEFRLWATTLAPGDLRAAVDFSYNLTKRAATIDWKEVDSLKAWLAEMPQNVINYINNYTTI